MNAGGARRDAAIAAFAQCATSSECHTSVACVINGSLTGIGVAHQDFQIDPSINPQLTFLRLGYEDDDYSDNGYWGHDDGTGDQCKAKFSGRNIDPIAMMAAVPNLLDQLRAHFDWLDQTLADGRSFLQGLAAGLADLAAYHPVWFLRQNFGSAAAPLQVLV